MSEHDDDAARQTTSERVGAASSTRVRVLVRCRPLSSLEQDHSCTRVCVTDRTSVTVRDPAAEARAFHFDEVLGPACDQADVFDHVAPLVAHVLDGFHATVLAYGQTGSGKTYTMDGLTYRQARQGGRSEVDVTATPVAQHGVVLRAIQRIFDEAHTRQAHPDAAPVSYSFRCSYFQMYKEKISDLLRPSGSAAAAHHGGGWQVGDETTEGLRLRWQRDDAFRVENLFLCECDSAEKMRSAFVKGARERVMDRHNLNLHSSRSHCVFTIHVEGRQRGGATESEVVVRRSELTLVDLAGSEKLGQLSSDPSARLVRESIEINTSLLTLGKVITALATRRQRGTTHIPYRDSKLTKLLKHALGGNSLTIMIACISPSDVYVEETVSTLLYAGRARNIENVPHVNEDPSAALLRELRAEVRRLRAELAQYQEMATRSITAHETAVQESLVRRNGDDNGASRLADASPLREQVEQLADSLLAACAMLKRVLHVNNALRAVYDEVKAANVAGAEREVQLNAENLQLRERIAVLESIVLQEDASAVTTDVTTGAVRESDQTPPPSSAPVAHVHERRRRHGRKPLASLLQDYTRRYRAAAATGETSYAAYYPRARAALPPHSAAATTMAKVDEMVRTLPLDEVAAYIPSSLRTASRFGTLSFGGSPEETAQYERRRQERAEKVEALLERQRALYATVRQDVRSLAEVDAGRVAKCQGRSCADVKLLYGAPDDAQAAASRRPHTSEDAMWRASSHGATRMPHSADLPPALLRREGRARNDSRDRDDTTRGGMARLLRYLRGQNP